MGDLDEAIKAVLREDPEAYARFLLERSSAGAAAAIVAVRPDETVYTAGKRQLDKILRVELERAHGRERARQTQWLHIEIEAVWRSTVPRRVYRYWQRASEAHEGEPVSSFVFVLKPDQRQRADPPGSYERETDLGTSLRFEFGVIRVWRDLDADELLRSGPDGLLALLPYAAGASSDRVDRALGRLARVRSPERRAELQAGLAVFATDVFPEFDWLARIPEEVVMRLKAMDRLREMARKQVEKEIRAEVRAEVQAEVRAEVRAEVQAEVRAEVQAEVRAEVQAEVQAEVRAEMLAALFERRLGELAPAKLAARLAACSDDVLERAIDLLDTERDAGALATALEALLPPE